MNGLILICLGTTAITPPVRSFPTEYRAEYYEAAPAVRDEFQRLRRFD